MITEHQLLSELKDRGYTVDLREVVKNSIHMTGMSVRDNENQRISPCVYIDGILQDYDNAIDAADKVISIISNCHHPDIDIENLLSRETLLSNVMIAVQRKSEQELIKRDSPFKDIEEYIYISGDDNNGSSWSIKLTPSHLKLATISEDELWHAAESNTFKEAEIYIEDIQSVLANMCGIHHEEMPDMPDTPAPMYVVTNRARHHGAVQVFNSELQRWAKNCGYNSLIVLPSSLHEAIVIPNNNDDLNLKELDNMIQEINATQVEPVDQLGDHAYVMNVAA